MPFPNREGRKPKVDYKEVADHWVFAKKSNPRYTKASCARLFRISRSTLTTILKRYGVFDVGNK
jgi:hypothetical protein